MDVISVIESKKLVPVVVFKTVGEALPVYEALRKGGLPIAEVCYRTEAAPAGLKALVEAYPDDCIGAGTVINATQAEEAISFGAKFIVSPGLSSGVANICKKHDIPYFPGIATATELMAALDLGINRVKFFPAGNLGGVKAMKALGAAFPQVRMMPTGGVNEENILDFLAYDHIFACGGSFMMKGTPEEIAAKTASALKLIGAK